MPRGLRDLSSLTRGWTQAVAVEALSPNHWIAREFPKFFFFQFLFIYLFIYGCVGSSFLCKGFL